MEGRKEGAAGKPAALAAAELEKRIEELEDQLAKAKKAPPAEVKATLPADPDAELDVDLPETPVGPIKINGRPFRGKMRIKRRELSQYLAMFSKVLRSERERMAERGNLVPEHRLDPEDIVSRIVRSRSGVTL